MYNFLFRFSLEVENDVPRFSEVPERELYDILVSDSWFGHGHRQTSNYVGNIGSCHVVSEMYRRSSRSCQYICIVSCNSVSSFSGEWYYV